MAQLILGVIPHSTEQDAEMALRALRLCVGYLLVKWAERPEEALALFQRDTVEHMRRYLAKHPAGEFLQ